MTGVQTCALPICVGLLATSNIGDTVFAQDTTKNINKTNNVEVKL